MSVIQIRTFLFLVFKKHRSLSLAFAFSSLLLFGPDVSRAHASSLEIQLSGVDITFSGPVVNDAGSAAFGAGDPADADPLDTVTFKVDGTPIGTLVGPPVGTDPISLDIHIPGVPPIPAGGGTVTTSGIPSGIFDLLTKSTASAIGLALDLDAVTITYIPISSSLSFVFAGSVASIDDQDLPFDLAIDEPVTVTLSTQTTSVTTAAGFIASFTASGTGEIRGDFKIKEQFIPEPSSWILLILGATLVTAGIRGRKLVSVKH